MNGLNQWLGPDVRLKGMNALKWATECAGGEENPLGNRNQPVEPCVVSEVCLLACLEMGNQVC